MATTSLPYQRPARAGAMPTERPGNAGVYLAVALSYMLMLLPTQFNVGIYTTQIPPYRFLLLACILFILAQILRKKIRLGWPDFLVTVATAWIITALFVTTDATEAFTSTVAQGADILIAYFFGRTTIRNLRDLRLLLLLMLPGVTFVGAVMAIEAITHTHIIQGFASQVTGKPLMYGSSPRLGLLRARGPFPHPIGAGIFMASFLPLYWLSGMKGWGRIIGIWASFGSFFAVSSGALLALLGSLGLLFYNWLSGRIANLTWRMFFVLAGITTFALELGTNSGTVSILIRISSLNSATGYGRVQIWRYGTANVEKNPWFGVGYGEWERPVWMPESIDNNWLMLAIQFGVLPPVLILAAVFMALVALSKKSTFSRYLDMRFERGIAMSLAIFTFGGATVAFWGSVQVWFFVFLGFAVTLGQQHSFARAPVRYVAPPSRYAIARP